MLKNICVQSTMDYGKFKTLVGNREVSEFNVKKLKESMSNRQLASIAIVNEKMEIIDGAHRKRVCEELGLPFNYIVMDGYGIEEVHILNTNMKNWTNEDFVRQFSDRFENGEVVFSDYKVLVDLMDYEKIPMGKALVLLENGKKSGTESLRGGSFTVSAETKTTYENLMELKELESELGSKVTSTIFWQGYVLAKQVEGFKFQIFLNKVKRSRADLESTKNKIEYMLETFEDVYNTRNRNPIPLKFSCLAIYRGQQ